MTDRLPQGERSAQLDAYRKHQSDFPTRSRESLARLFRAFDECRRQKR